MAHPAKDDMLRSLRLIADTVTRASKMLDGLRRPDAAPGSLAACRVDEIVAATGALVARVASAVDVCVDWHSDEAEAAIGGVELQQILLNLALNAVEALPPGGRVTLDARRDGSRIHLMVSDTGPGIPADQVESIFTPGFSTKRGDARGIGLAVARRLTHAAGGRLWVDTRPGATSFHLDVPGTAQP
jgi:signal transduction histidine kinase